MSNILKISEAASLAMHAAVLLADGSGAQKSTREIADLLRASEAHLSKVLQRLTKAGIVRSTRGPRGGFVLAKPAGDLTLLDVYESMEGSFEPAVCIFDAPVCNGGPCIFGGLLETVNRRFRDSLSGTALSDLASVFEKGQTDA